MHRFVPRQKQNQRKGFNAQLSKRLLDSGQIVQHLKALVSRAEIRTKSREFSRAMSTASGASCS
jgi:hypothetical protein